jgi:hypothetical protein
MMEESSFISDIKSEQNDLVSNIKSNNYGLQNEK